MRYTPHTQSESGARDGYRSSTSHYRVNQTRHSSMHTCMSHDANACPTSSVRVQAAQPPARCAAGPRGGSLQVLACAALAAAIAAAWAARDSKTCLRTATKTLRKLPATSASGQLCPRTTEDRLEEGVGKLLREAVAGRILEVQVAVGLA